MKSTLLKVAEDHHHKNIFRPPFAECWIISSSIYVVLRAVQFEMQAKDLIRIWAGETIIYVYNVEQLLI